MEETSLLSLKEVSKNSPYGADYLSLLIRSQKLFGKKVDGKWMTTPEAVADYAQKIAQANFAHQESLKVKIPAAEQKKALVNLKWAFLLAVIVIIILAAWGWDAKSNANANAEFIIQKDSKNNLTIQVDDPSAIGSVTIVSKK